LPNAEQHLGHLRFSRKSSRLNHFLDHPTWLLLAPEARPWGWQGQFWDSLHSG
jgi:hypothetical protein